MSAINIWIKYVHIYSIKIHDIKQLKMFNIRILCFLITAICFGQTSETENWFPFEPSSNLSNSRIEMNSWLDAPAGKHGFLNYENENLVFEDGTPIKFWGVNIASNNVFTNHKNAEVWTNTLSTYGVNNVRFHKFSSVAMNDTISTNLKADKYQNLDFFSNQLKERGIYYSWSPIYGHKPKQGDSIKMLAYHEIASANLNNHLSYSTIGLVNFAEDLQDLHIELMVNMLNHKNPYTGLKYANDPALTIIELQNENDIFFSSTDKMLEKCPSYKELLTKRFKKWLLVKYKSTSNFNEAWGEKAFRFGKNIRNVNWDLEKGNITPVASHGIYDYEFKKAVDSGKPLPIFLSDMATFLFEQQTSFYKRFVKEIRNTGYKGVIVGSCWQAGSGVSHYYNLYSDYEVGIIDRHNYFGGGTGHTFKPGKFNNEAMVKTPGFGLLNTGFQQVIDRPFSISEWMSIIPNEWNAESSPIIAAYGMGLQGWDASFSFSSQKSFFTPMLQIPSKIWPSVYNVMSPTQLSLYPALARMIYRNDVEEGEVISVRNVNTSELSKGNVGFNEVIKQNKDVKNFKSIVPNEALAVGKVVVEFTDEFKTTTVPDLSKFWNLDKNKIKSNTGQLEWDYSKDGFFTINTKGTKGTVGFTSNKKIKLSNIELQTKTPFAVVLISSLEKSNTINTSNHILITTIARAKNIGMEYNNEKTELINVGEAPILLEPVNTKITFNNRKIKKVIALDHVGNSTTINVDFNNETVHFKGEKYKTMYYEVILE